MINTLKELIKLQSVDNDIFALRKEQNLIPNKLREKKSEYEKAVNESNKIKEKQKDLTVECDKIKLDIAAEEQHKKDLHQKQSLVKKNNEYQALTKEIKASDQKKKSLEELLESKKAVLEETSAAFLAQHKAVERLKKEFLQEAEKAKQKIGEFEQKINKYKLLRKDITKTINPEIFSLYSNLLKTRAPNVVVKAKNNVCQGCHINLTAQVIVDIKKAEKIVTCENCARILFLEEETVKV